MSIRGIYQGFWMRGIDRRILDKITVDIMHSHGTHLRLGNTGHSRTIGQDRIAGLLGDGEAVVFGRGRASRGSQLGGLVLIAGECSNRWTRDKDGAGSCHSESAEQVHDSSFGRNL